MKHNKTQNKLIRKNMRKNTRKNMRKNTRKMKGGGGWLDYFTNFSVGIPGLGKVGKCQAKQIWENGIWKKQECYLTPMGPIYKTIN